MSVIKPLSGHGNIVDCKCRQYLFGLGQWEDKYHGKRCSKVTYIHIDPDEKNIRNWDEQMDYDRECYGTNKQIGNKPVRTYNQYIFSPDPQDNITVDDLDKAIKEWAERVFQNKFSIVIGYQNDNSNRIQHAHMYINNLNWDFDDTAHKRIGSYVTPQCWEFANQLWQYMCEERGWHSFIEKQIKDTEFKKYIDQGKYDFEPKYISEEVENLFKIDKEYFRNHKYFNHDIDYRRPYRKISNIKGQYCTKPPFSTKFGKRYTKGAKEAKKQGKHLWTDDLRDLIEISYYQSNNIVEMLTLLSKYDINVEITNDKDFKFTHPERSTWVATGKKLGNDYRRDRLISLFNTQDDIEKRPYKPTPIQKKKITRQIREIGYTLSNKHINYIDPKTNLTLEDLAKTIRICSKINCWTTENFNDLIEDENNVEILFAKRTISKLESLDNIREQFELNNPIEPKSYADIEHIPKDTLYKSKKLYQGKLLKEMKRVKISDEKSENEESSRNQNNQFTEKNHIYTKEK